MFDRVNDAAVDPTGRIIIVGGILDCGDLDATFGRFNSDGTLDSSFGTSGYVIHVSPAGGIVESVESVSLDGTGRIVATGKGYDPSSLYDMIAWRINIP